VYLIEIKIWHLEILAKAMHANVWFGSKAAAPVTGWRGSYSPDNGHEIAAKHRQPSAERFRSVDVAGHRPPPQAPRQSHRAVVRQASTR
jgi:hypothetical protein